MGVEQLNMDNPVFRTFAAYAAAVVLKMMFMSFVTAYHRMTKNVYINEEDAAAAKGPKKIELTANNPSVERVRRCHQNDLENVIPFVLLGLLYVASGPALWTAQLHFRIFTAARFLHTIIYLNSVRQPFRALSFLTGVGVCVSMGVAVIGKSTF